MVIDTDGSAFITKAEFDSLKNNFQSQIDNYNSSIDSKIDGAIAAYLAGIKISTMPILYIDAINSAAGGTLWFEKAPTLTTTSTSPCDMNLVVQRDLYLKFFEPQYFGILVGKPTSSRDNVELQAKYGDTSSASHSRMYQNTFQPINESYPYTDFRRYMSTTWYTAFDTATAYTGTTYNSPQTKWGKKESTYTTLSSSNIAGSGSVLILRKDNSGRDYAYRYASTRYPVATINLFYHGYKNHQSTKADVELMFDEENKFAQTTVPTLDITSISSVGIANSGGTKPGPTSTTDGATYWESLIAELHTFDSWNYEITQMSSSTANSLYTSIEDFGLTSASSVTTYTTPDTTFQTTYYRASGGAVSTNTMKGCNVKYKKLSITNNSKKWNQLVQNVLSQVAGEAVYLGNGMKVANVIDEGDYALKLKLKRNSGSTSTNINVKVSDKKFVDGAFATGAKQYANVTYTLSQWTSNTYTLNLSGVPADSDIWINIDPASTGVIAGVDTLTIT